MPRVPELQQQFVYKAPRVPGARLQGYDVRTDAAMFGSETGRAMEKAGHTIERGVQWLGHLYRDYQHTKATEAYTKFQESLTDDLYGENGLFNLRGEAAMSAPAKTKELLEARASEYRDKLSELGQSFFDGSLDRYKASLMPQMARHATDQRNQWMQNTYEAQAALAADRALQNYTDQNAYRQHVVDGRDAVRRAGELAGLPSEAIQKNLAAFTSKTYVGIASAYISKGAYSAAEGLIKSGVISGADAIRLEDHISGKKKADLQLSLTMKHEAERNAAKKWEDDITMALESRDMSKAVQLAVNAPAGFRKEGFALIDHYAKGQRVVNDDAAVWEWQQKMVNDPESFIREWNPTQHLNSMDSATRDKFTTDWKKLKAGDKMHQDQVVTDAALLHEAYAVMGIKNSAKATGDALAKVMSFNRRFQEEIDVFSAEKKRKPTGTEKMGIRDNMLVVAQKSKGFMGFGEKTTFAFELDKEPERPRGLPSGAAWDKQRGGWIYKGRFLPASAVTR